MDSKNDAYVRAPNNLVMSVSFVISLVAECCIEQAAGQGLDSKHTKAMMFTLFYHIVFCLHSSYRSARHNYGEPSSLSAWLDLAQVSCHFA